MMDEERFWEIIHTSRERARRTLRDASTDFADVHQRTMKEVLRALTADELMAFQARFDDYRGRAYRNDLWAVAYWMHGGCSDDSFMDFRACLISLGRERYFAALADPDSLADIVGAVEVPTMTAEGFQYLAREVYREKSGGEMPRRIGGPPHPREPAGESFDFDDADEMKRRFPRLVRKLPDGG